MSKHTYYFKHDLNAHEDEKILDLRMEHGMEGYGIYWLLVELLASSTNYAMDFNPKRIAFSNSANEQVVKSVIEDFGLFVVDGGTFMSKSLNDRMMRLDEIKNKRAEAGRKGGKTKANAKQLLSKTEANAKQMLSKPQAIAKQKQAEERREEESKGKESKEDDNTMDEGYLRIAKMFTPQMKRTTYARGERSAWNSVKSTIKEHDYELLEDFYGMEKSARSDLTWRRKQQPVTLLNNIEEQLDLAYEMKESLRKSQPQLGTPTKWS